MSMLGHLELFEPDVENPEPFTALEKAPPKDIVSAQVATAQWLEELGVPSDEEIDAQKQVQAARDAFAAQATPVHGIEEHELTDLQRQRLAELKTPPAVQHLTGMLAAYDWEFIHLAQELRGYAVAKIVEETRHNDARIRLKALQMLGNVTEVGLFTEKIEVTRKNATDEELEARLRERLEKYMGVVDATPTGVDAPVALPAAFTATDASLDAEIVQVVGGAAGAAERA